MRTRIAKFWREFKQGFNAGVDHGFWALDYHTALTTRNSKARDL